MAPAYATPRGVLEYGGVLARCLIAVPATGSTLD
jgi:hypothetical protein